jgi:hypothetical protein
VVVRHAVVGVDRRHDSVAASNIACVRSLLLLIAAGLFITIANVGAAAQTAYLDRPIWALVVVAELCVAWLVYRLWKS